MDMSSLIAAEAAEDKKDPQGAQARAEARAQARAQAEAAAAKKAEINKKLRLLNHYMTKYYSGKTLEDFRKVLYDYGIEHKVPEEENTYTNKLYYLKRVFVKHPKFYDTLQKFVEAHIKKKGTRRGQQLNYAEKARRLKKIEDGFISELVTLLEKKKIPFFDKYYGRTIDENDEDYLKYLQNLIIEYENFNNFEEQNLDGFSLLDGVSLAVGGSRKGRRRVRTRKVNNKSIKRGGSKKGRRRVRTRKVNNKSNKRGGSKKSKKNNNIKKINNYNNELV